MKVVGSPTENDLLHSALRSSAPKAELSSISGMQVRMSLFAKGLFSE